MKYAQRNLFMQMNTSVWHRALQRQHSYMWAGVAADILRISLVLHALCASIILLLLYSALL